MRNLKKFLALVLAMMMAFSLMVTVNASASIDFTDKDSITDEFSEAIAVLEGLEVFEGYPDETFKPKNNITRAEVATIVYRLATGDVKGDQAHLYADYQKFDDVKSDHWAAGYINYCANAEWIAGYGNGKFGPNDSVTGYQAAAMILRAVGYGKNGEFQGSGWQVQVANVTRSKGLLYNVDKTTYANTLNKAAPRELVAEILFQAGLIPQVIWSQLGGYSEYNNVLGAGSATSKNDSLAWENFKLNVSPYQTVDKWGRPGYYWFKGTTLNATLSNEVATIKADPVKTYDKAVNECDVAHDLEFTGYRDYNLYVNSEDAFDYKYRVEATDVITKVGGQGRITEFYDTLVHPWTDRNGNDHPDWVRSVVMIDTFLAKVTKVEKEVLDAAGHQMIPAKLTLMVYDGYSDSEAGTNAKSVPAGNERVAVKASGNWEFAKGDFVTLNAYTNHAAGININDGNNSHDGTAAANNAAAFEAEQTAVSTATGAVANQFAYVTNITKCEPVLGKQTTIYWNQGKHNVNNEDKLDQLDLHLDVAGSTVDTTFAWYYDAKGNLIGIGDAPANINYGIITSIYSAFKQGEANTTGEAVAVANVLYADGSNGTVTIDKFLMTNAAAANGGHNTAGKKMSDPGKGQTSGGSLSAEGIVELLPVYDNGSGNVMSATVRGDNTTSVDNAGIAGWLHVAPVAAVNANTEATNTGKTTPWGETTNGSFGVIRGNLFKFVNSGDNSVTAIEVAGKNWDAIAGNNNDGIYAGHSNVAVATAAAELSKNYAYLTAGGTTIRMDNDTKIMVRGAKMNGTNNFTEATNTVTVYDGIDELPSSIIVPIGAEIDWADIDGNGIADVVYVYGLKKGVSGYGLFYYNGSAGQWTGSAATGSGWLRGWLDGKETDLTFTNKALFDRVQQSTVEYGGHLFAVKLFDGTVDTLLGANLTTHTPGDKDYFLIADTASVIEPNATAVILGSLGEDNGTTTNVFTVADGIKSVSTTATFKVGTDNGNDYVYPTGGTTANSTTAIWLKDYGQKQNVDNTVPGMPTQYTDVQYNASLNAIEVYTYTVTGGVASALSSTPTATYYLSGNSVTAGDGLYFLNIDNRVNDVTLVLEGSANNTIRQLYVTTRPDITPPGSTGTVTTTPGTPGADVQRIIGLNDTQLVAALKAAGPNKVIYSPEQKAYPADRADAKNLLYFPFTGTAATAAATGTTLTILNSKGAVVYLETENATMFTAGTGYSFRLDMSGAHVSADATIHECFTADTYRYTIVNSGVTLSSGTFTVG